MVIRRFEKGYFIDVIAIWMSFYGYFNFFDQCIFHNSSVIMGVYDYDIDHIIVGLSL